MMNFRVYDFSGRSWKDQVRDQNILGGLNIPRIRSMEVFMPEFYQDRYWHNYGIPPQWGCYDGGGMWGAWPRGSAARNSCARPRRRKPPGPNFA